MSIQGKENPGYVPGEDALYWKTSGNDGNDVTFGKQRGGVPAVLKTLLVILVLCVLIMVALVIAVVMMQREVREIRAQTHNSVPTPAENKDVCLTRECITASADILSSIDERVHPCDNLYEFACGKWVHSRVIPSDRSGLSTFEELSEDVGIKLKTILQHSQDDSAEGIKARNLYASCVDTDIMNSRGDQILKDFLKAEIGDWPILTSSPPWIAPEFDLTDLLVKVWKYSTSAIVDVWIGTNDKSPENRILKIDQASLGMPGLKYYLVPRNDSMLMAYEDFIYNIVTALGAADPTTVRQEVKDIVDLEIALAEICVPAEERRDSEELYNPLTLAELHGNYSQEYIDWPRFFRSLMSTPDIGVTDLGDDEIIINRSPQYYANYTAILRNTSNRTLANYVFWRFAQGYAPLLTDQYREYRQNYFKAVYGTSGTRPRELTCAIYTGTVMSSLVGRRFVETYFDVDSKSEVLSMISNLLTAFNELVSELTWMDEDTKAAARDKSVHITSKIGFPEQILNDTYLQQIYSNITFNSAMYLENVIGVHHWWNANSLRQLREKVDKTRWSASPQTVNAYYSSLRNEIVFPAGILQPPFFSKHFPKSLNYGSIGTVIGHEITHGFDDRGRQYDKFGELKDWWSDEATANFKLKAQCLIDQYGNFTYETAGLNVNGINTQGENIADNGGIKQSFRAYRNWVREQGQEEKLLPGLEKYSHNQLFFIGFARTWCNMIRKESAINRIRTGVHSPGRFRAIGVAQNSQDFAQAFNCPTTSYMNPPNKCSVW